MPASALAPRNRRRLPAVPCLLAALLAFSASAGAETAPPPRVVPAVDLERYLGTWYEIASIPNRFQRHCRGNTKAEYRSAGPGHIEVVNSCLDKDGAVDSARGVARVVDKASKAKLEVSFVSLFGWQLFWGDYWILDLAADYSYALVGTPDRRFGWVLSRTPGLPAQSRTRVDRRLREAGYDPNAFVDTPQGAD